MEHIDDPVAYFCEIGLHDANIETFVFDGESLRLGLHNLYANWGEGKPNPHGWPNDFRPVTLVYCGVRKFSLPEALPEAVWNRKICDDTIGAVAEGYAIHLFGCAGWTLDFECSIIGLEPPASGGQTETGNVP